MNKLLSALFIAVGLTAAPAFAASHAGAAPVKKEERQDAAKPTAAASAASAPAKKAEKK